MDRIDFICLVLFFIGMALLMSLGYLAACAGAGRWLTFSEWIGKK